MYNDNKKKMVQCSYLCSYLHWNSGLIISEKSTLIIFTCHKKY